MHEVCMMEWPHQAQTYQFRKHIFAVRNELLAGWSEHIYHHALERSLRADGIPVLSKPRLVLTHRGKDIHVFEPDLVAWDSIVLELKVLPYHSKFASEHYAQVIHYLKFFQTDLDLLVNFAPSIVDIKRVIWKEPKLDVHEDFRDSRSLLSAAQQDLVQTLHDVVLDIVQQYGLGYPDSICRNLIVTELRFRRIEVSTEVEVPANWRGNTLAYHRTPLMLVENQVLVHVCALPNFPKSYEFARTKTYLASMNLGFALLVNFGHKQLQIFGITKD